MSEEDNQDVNDEQAKEEQKGNIEEINLSQDQQKQLLQDLKNTQDELNNARSAQVQQLNPQDKFIETLFDKGGAIFLKYSEMTTKVSESEMEYSKEIEKAELKAIQKLDFRDKIYKGFLIGLCIVALVTIPLFVPKSEMVIPVLSLIIGLLFKSSSVSDFFAFKKSSKNETDE